MIRPTVLQCFILGALSFGPMSPMRAQPTRAAIRVEPGSLEADRLKTSVDLTVKDVGLSGLGQIVFTLQNRGGIGINPGKFTVSPNAINTPPVRMDVYLGGALVQSVYQASLGGGESKAFAVMPVSNVPRCKETRDIKVVVDPSNVVPELHDDNNTVAVTVARPCPDLAVKSIEREKSGTFGETYQVKVTVINSGNAPAPAFQAWGTASTEAPGLTGWPEMVPMHEIGALAPGQTYVFHIGGDQLSVVHTWVRVFLDLPRHVDELDETNNLVDKTL